MPKIRAPWDDDFPAEAFVSWQRNAGLSNAAVARLFRVKPQTVGRWKTDGAPRIAMWACAAWGLGFRPPGTDEAINPPVQAISGKPRGNPRLQKATTLLGDRA